MKVQRNVRYRKHWTELTLRYGEVCFYCNEEIATCIDHVIPYSYDQDNSIENLVPSCALCNVLAWTAHFDNVEQKRQYILNRRKRKSARRAICTDCLLPFAYREHSPSLFLCAECYDKEYGTDFSDSALWSLWLVQLEDAGIYVSAHRRALKKAGRHNNRTRNKFIANLIEGYEMAEGEQVKETSAVYFVNNDQRLIRLYKKLAETLFADGFE